MEYIRIARPEDAPAVLDIYGPFVSGSAITFETEIPSAEVMSQRIGHYLEKWPWLIYESQGAVAGYAYATHHRERAAYQWCVESSVYVDPGFHGKGIAARLYQSLFSILQFQGIVHVYAGITLPNEKSVQFHRKQGFDWIGDYKNIGYKLHQWHTVSWWQLSLNPCLNPPSQPVAFPAIPPYVIRSMIPETLST